MSGATTCKKFVRNAWKKELCSNCFKAKEEHPEKPTLVSQIHMKLPDPPTEGILKRSSNKRNSQKNNKVVFPATEFEVIGYGGDDVYSDDDEPDFERSTREEPDTDQDRALQKLTKTNTDFNSNPANLLGADKIEPVCLGKKLVDDKGKKKTLLVSVTPFGGSSANSCATGRVQPVLNSIPTDINKHIVENNNEKEVYQGNGATKQVVFNNKIDDGLEKSEHSLPNPTVAPKVVDVGIKRSQPIDKNSKFRPSKECSDEVKICNQIMDGNDQSENRVSTENKLNDKLTTSTKVANLLDKAKRKVHQLPVIGDPNHFKFKTIDFSSANNKKLPVDNKAVVLDMYNIKTDLKATELSVEPLPKLLSSQIKVTPTIIFETKKSEDGEINTNVAQTYLPKSNVSSLHRSPKAGVKVEMQIDQIGDISAESTVTAETETPPKNNCSNDTDAQTELCDKLDNYEGIIGGEEVTVFSLENKKIEGCREDGKVEKHAEPAASVPALDGVDGLSENIPNEPPALPASPPPAMDPRVSFLHQLTGDSKFKLGEKPKVPAKPSVIPCKKSQFRVFLPRPKSPSQETFLDAPATPPQSHHPPLSETLSDSTKKRPAPQPPSPRDEIPSLRSAHSSDNILGLSQCSQVPFESAIGALEPITRRSLSLSQDCLLNSGVSEMQIKKKSGRGRFSLRKLLHLGKHKEGGKDCSRREYRIEGFKESSSLRSKSIPEIIHPLDLTGARLEVVPPHRLVKSRRSSSSASSSSGEHRDSDVPSDSSASQSVSSSGNSGTDAHVSLERSRKPPPPPRSVPHDHTDKPARPPPPKTTISPEGERKELSQSVTNTPHRPRDNVYVNIGEVRSGLAPNKPVRTGSLREIDIVKKLAAVPGGEDLETKKHYWTGSLRGPPKCTSMGPPEDSGYESFDVSLTTSDSHTSSQTSSLTAEENLYECVQAPGQLSISVDNSILRCGRHINYRPDYRSEGSVPDGGQDYIKFRFLRSVSMPYCGSEAESEIYSPYSFCGSEMGEDDYEWSPTSGRFQKVSRLKMKKGRSIVHKNLEDNYGAVIVANHEALTQVVEQMHQGPLAPASLRPLSSAHNLRWADFSIVKDNSGVIVEQRAFFPALWGLIPVTLCLAPEQSTSSLHGKPPFSLQPLTELHDLVPACFLPNSDAQDQTLVQCSISVLSRISLETLTSYCRSISNATLTDEIKKEIHFILLQTINALKTLQAAGIEEAPRELVNMVISREERDPHPRVCVLPGPVCDSASLCASLLDLLEALPATELSSLLGNTLRAEKAVSLSQAKALLEFTLWGPADIAFGGGPRAAALQRWLDLERASVLHGLVRTRADLSVFEEWHLLFLVHTNAKVLADASLLLEIQAVDC